MLRQPSSAIKFSLAVFVCLPVKAQLTTGLLQGSVQDVAGHPVSHCALLLAGGLTFQMIVYTDSAGQFTLALPYGRYFLSRPSSSQEKNSPVTVVVNPLQTDTINFTIDGASTLRRSPHDSSAVRQQPVNFGPWSDTSRAALFPEGFSLQSILGNREGGTVTVPLDFTGITDGRLALVSNRGFSWTATQFQWQGLDVTDSYQPGRPAIFPDMQSISDLVVRTDSALLTSESYGNEVGTYLAEPSSSWHAAISTFNTGAALSSSSGEPAGTHGGVQQPERFRWFTRDRLEAGGPLKQWADLFASGAGQWSSQTVGLAAPSFSPNSQILFGTVRGRVRAGARDQFDAEYSGSRLNLSNGGIPAGIEALVSRRLSPELNQPDGFSNEAERDSFVSFGIGWTRHLRADAGLGALQVRYGYSSAHLSTWPATQTVPDQSRIELLGSAVTGMPLLTTIAVRPRHELAIAWQPAPWRTGSFHQQITIGGDWKLASPDNRMMTPSNLNLVTVDGAPAYVVEYNTPVNSLGRLHSGSAYLTDHLVSHARFSVDAGVLADISRCSLPAQNNSVEVIAWNQVSPRVALTINIPHAHGFTVRGAYLRLYSPLAGRYLDYANPNSLGGVVYGWTDRNGDGWFQPGEASNLLLRFGGPYSSISSSLQRPYSDEFDVSGQFPLTSKLFARIQLFRRDEKRRIAALDTGLGSNAFSPVPIPDPGPDGIPGTFDDGQLTVYGQNPATFGRDQYLLTNVPGLRTLNTGFQAQIQSEWRGLFLHAAFTVEKAWGPTNLGNAVWENDPDVIGTLFTDPNYATRTLARSYVDRAYLGKVQAVYRVPSAWGGWQFASVANYLDGLPFARQLLVSGVLPGPFLTATTVRGSPEGGNRAQYVWNWNLRLQREFRLRAGRITVIADLLNVLNASQQIQQIDLTGRSFNARLPVAIQPARSVRFGVAYEF